MIFIACISMLLYSTILYEEMLCDDYAILANMFHCDMSILACLYIPWDHDLNCFYLWKYHFKTFFYRASNDHL